MFKSIKKTKGGKSSLIANDYPKHPISFSPSESILICSRNSIKEFHEGVLQEASQTMHLRALQGYGLNASLISHI